MGQPFMTRREKQYIAVGYGIIIGVLGGLTVIYLTLWKFLGSFGEASAVFWIGIAGLAVAAAALILLTIIAFAIGEKILEK